MAATPIRERRIDPDSWDDAISDLSGAQIVVGGPGTGKTEFLVRRALHLVEDIGIAPSELLVLGFGRRGTADLRDRIRSGLSRSVPEIDIATFHSLAARIVEPAAEQAGWDTAPSLLTGPEQVDVVQRLLAGSPRESWSPLFRGLLGSSTFATEVTDFILRAREQLLTSGDIAALAAGRADWRGLGEFIDAYDDHLRATGRIDYGSLLAVAVATLSSGPQSILGHKRFVLVDEYQDTSRAQARMLELLVEQGAHLTAAADPYQSIYSFRGADVRNVERFPETFGAGDDTPVRIILTTSFRTPRAVLEAAERVTGGRLPGAAGPVVAAPGEGRVDVYRFDQETEEAEWIADEMQRLHLEDDIAYSAMGVFVRSKRRFIPDLVRALHRRGMPHEEPDARLVEKSATRFVLDLVLAATGADGPAATARAVRRLLLGPLYAMPLEELRRVERDRLSLPGGDWGAAISGSLHRAAELSTLLGDPTWAVAEPADRGLWRIWTELDAIGDVVTDPERAGERADWASLAQVLRRWTERNPSATLADYRRLAEQEDFEARPLLSYRARRGDAPTVTTLHQSKGLEFDVVFIADAVEGVFPDLRSRDSLLGVRHVMEHLPSDEAQYRAYRLQEERRLAYTVMARARRRVIWTATSTGFEEGRGIPSRFQALAAGTSTVAAAASRPPRPETPVTPRQAEGLLARIAADPALAAARRAAAVSVLSERRDERLRDPRLFSGMRRRGPDTGVVAEGFTVSPSQAESYDTCPRRYVFERRLDIGVGRSVYLEFGSLLHSVLEDVEREAMDRGARHGELDDALAALDRAFDPAVFGGPPFSEAWLRRAMQALSHLYGNWPSSRAPIALEHDLELAIEGRTWRGRADRIESDGAGSVAVVDYKTSRSAARIADVAESLQLAFYVVAGGADPAIAIHGQPGIAEMWYPAAAGKSVVTRSFDMRNLDSALERLRLAAEGIAAEDWQPRPGPHCERCPVRSVCPAWPEGREAFV